MQQHMEALARANEVRMARATIKRGLRTGAVDPADLIVDPPDPLAKVKVGEFLMWVPGVGRDRAQRILRRQGYRGVPLVGFNVALGRMGEHTRAEVARNVTALVPARPRVAAAA